MLENMKVRGEPDYDVACRNFPNATNQGAE
jgi:hypothetical protein